MREITLLKSRLDLNGGAEKYAKQLLHAFVEKNYRVRLLTSGPPGFTYYQKGVTTYSLTNNQWMSFSKVRTFNTFCKELTQGIEHPIFGLDRNSFQTHMRASNGVHAAYLKRRTRTCSLLKKQSFHINPLHRILLKIEKEAFTAPNLRVLITNSSLVKDEILDHYPVHPNKIHVVHNGVEWQEMQPHFDTWETERTALLKKHQLPLDPFYFLFSGHHYERKGLKPLLHGLALIPAPDIHLIVIGKEKNKIPFQELCKELKLERRVHFFEEQNNSIPYLQLADSLVVPSYYDPFANITVEALAMGLFVVSSKDNGGHEVLTEESGTVIESLEDPAAVAAALKIALQHKKTPQNALGIRSAIKRLDFKSQLTHITNLIRI